VNRQRHPADAAPGLGPDEIAALRRLLGFDRPRQHMNRVMAYATIKLICLANQPVAIRQRAADLRSSPPSEPPEAPPDAPSDDVLDAYWERCRAELAAAGPPEHVEDPEVLARLARLVGAPTRRDRPRKAGPDHHACDPTPKGSP
jgi:hypothetical protein